MEKTIEKKLTKVEKFALLRAIPGVAENPMLTEFIDHEVELLEKKSGAEKKPTKNQIANEAIKNTICESMTPGERYTVTGMIKDISALNEHSPQKMTSLLRQLVDEKRVNRSMEKRVSYYSLAE